MLRVLKQRTARFQLLPALSDRVVEHRLFFTFHSSFFTLILGLPTLDRFPRFSAKSLKWPSICIQVVPKTAEIDQTWPFFLLPSSAVALPHYPQPLTKHTWAIDLSPQAKHRDARPRAVGARECGSWARLPHVFNPRSRVCGVSLVATGQDTTRILLIVAGGRRSATARGWNGKMANLFRFAPFRGKLEVQSPTMK